MKKVWKFYKKPTEEMKKYDNKEIRLDVKYPLYAVTADKNLAKIFRRTRNMKLFIEKTGFLEKEELEDYLRVHDHSRLNIYSLATYKDKNLETQEPMTADVCMTKNEYNYTTEAEETGGILNLISGWIPVKIFTPKIEKLLIRLGYQKCMQYVFQGDLPFDPDMTDGFSYYDLNLEFDVFGIFVILYQDTFSKDFFEHVKMTHEYFY